MADYTQRRLAWWLDQKVPLLTFDATGLREFSKRAENPMFSDFTPPVSEGGLWTPKINPFDETNFPYASMVGGLADAFFAPSPLFSWIMTKDKEPAPLPPESSFEVNLTEALVGWRIWKLTGNLLTSWNSNTVWNPDWPLQAEGRCRYEHSLPPHEHCTCGIYAADSVDDTPDDDDVVIILGQVYGWGRYVRGDSGWRAQFAYPKSFHLNANQAEAVDPLRKYHVPIFIEQPIKIYDPAEDGYEHREDEQNWNLGASVESASAQGGDSSDDEDEED
jgi:hypothetical protein